VRDDDFLSDDTDDELVRAAVIQLAQALIAERRALRIRRRRVGYIEVTLLVALGLNIGSLIYSLTNPWGG
jgi:hypothetical protein